jgi:pimeloyl-ACP methyl ester carboxylesterase
MGGYTSLEDDILDPGSQHSTLESTFRRLIVWSMSAQLGVPARQSHPASVLSQISPRPILLVYGEYEASDGEAMLAAALSPAELWIVPGSGHAGYRYAAPDEYRQRIVRFFDSAFGIVRPNIAD